MTFSYDVESALNYIENDGVALRKRSDIGVLLECGVETGDADSINSLVFHGKNAWSAYLLLRKMRQSDEGFQNIEREFMENINAMRILLVDLTNFASKKSQLRFDETYLGMTQGTLRNLADLAHDLAAFKNLQNKNKYSAKSDAENIEQQK